MKHVLHCPPQARGVTLIELMIGMAVALATTVVIAQVIIQTDGQRRGSSAVADAQMNGSLSLNALQREIMSAGYGVSERAGMFGCPMTGRVDGTTYNTDRFAPLEIVNGGANGESDSIVILSSGKFDISAAMRMTRAYTGGDTALGVSTTLGVKSKVDTGVKGDLVAVIPAPDDIGKPCTMHFVDDTPPGSIALTLDSQAIMPLTGYAVGATIVNLGQNPWRQYGVDNKYRLVERAFDPVTKGSALPTEMFTGIANMQVYYGRTATSLPTDSTVVAYNTVQPTNGDEWRTVRTIRLVIVTKSQQRERDPVTLTQPQLGAGAGVTVSDTATCAAPLTGQCIPLKVDNDPDWQFHRYRVYDTVVPLRNLLWNLYTS
jgi:type IV pilus assembly protein PilW